MEYRILADDFLGYRFGIDHVKWRNNIELILTIVNEDDEEELLLINIETGELTPIEK